MDQAYICFPGGSAEIEEGMEQDGKGEGEDRAVLYGSSWRETAGRLLILLTCACGQGTVLASSNGRIGSSVGATEMLQLTFTP